MADIDIHNKTHGMCDRKFESVIQNIDRSIYKSIKYFYYQNITDTCRNDCTRKYCRYFILTKIFDTNNAGNLLALLNL